MTHLLDLHGLVTVAVHGDDADLAVVRRQVGDLPPADHDERADLTVRFVDRLETGELTLLGRNDFAYDERSFVVLRGKHKSRIRAILPIDRIGEPGGCEIVVERGAPAVPLLVAVLNLIVVANGGLALHAAAFHHGGKGVVVTGWSKGGKTETLLAMLDAGARYIGDEWVMLGGGGTWAGGLAEPVRIWDWYLPQVGPLASRVDRTDRARLAALRVAGRACATAQRTLPSPLRRQARRAGHLVEGQRHVDLPARHLNGDGRTGGRVGFDVLVHAVSAETDTCTLEPADPALVARRMAASLAAERFPLWEAYHAFRYAFPHRRSVLLEDSAALETERLATFFKSPVCVELRHPYPPALADLRRLLTPVLER